MTTLDKIQDQAFEFLQSNKLGVIATVNREHRPQAATMHYFVEKKGDGWCLYFATRASTRKFTNLESNPNIAIVVGTVMDRATLQMEGIARMLSNEEVGQVFDDKEKRSFFEFMQADEKDPFFQIEGLNFRVFKVDISWARFMFFDEVEQHEVFKQIIP